LSMGARTQELLSRVFRHVERGCRFRIRIEFAKDGRVVTEVLLERLNPCPIGWMVGKELGELLRVRVLECLKQPNQTPRIVTSSRVDKWNDRQLGSLSLFRLDAADDSIENSRLCLLDRGDGIVDRERCLPLQPFGMVVRAFDASIML
jgi:hypothetical protein